VPGPQAKLATLYATTAKALLTITWQPNTE